MKDSVLDRRPVVKCTEVVLNRCIEPDHKDKRQMCAKNLILVILLVIGYAR